MDDNKLKGTHLRKQSHITKCKQLLGIEQNRRPLLEDIWEANNYDTESPSLDEAQANESNQSNRVKKDTRKRGQI